MLYEVALVRIPTKKDQEDGKLEELIMSPEAVIARDEKSAAVKAVAGKQLDNLDNVEVLVRPFA